MSLKLAGVQLGNLTGGPSSITLADLADVSIVSPVTGQYLRYNSGISEWQNTTIDSDVFAYLDSKMTASDGIGIIYSSGPNTIAFDLGNITPTSVAASGTVTGSNISGSNTGDQTITLTGDVTGTGTGTFAATLATVNSSPQSNTFRRITVNGKGLTTATSAVTSGDITTALGYTPVNKAGDTMTGLLLLSADPSAALGAATKQYVDNVASGIVAKPAVLAATTANLTSTYSNGTLGVGATLTSTTNGAWPGVDGVTTGWTIGMGVLVKNQSAPAQNGRYNLTTVGDGSNPWVLTRCALCDTASEIPGSYVFVQDGTQVGTGWVAIVADPLTFVVGTDAITWAQFSGSGTYTAGTGIDISSNVISNTGVLSNIAGTGISVSGATGNVTLTNTGVTSAVAGSNIAVSGATGAVTFSVTGTVPLATSIAGGTAGQLLYQSGAGTTATLATSTSGLILTSQGVGVAPAWVAPASTASLTATQIGFGDGSNELSGSANFTWDDTTSTLSFNNASAGTIIRTAPISSGTAQHLEIRGTTHSAGTGGNLSVIAGSSSSTGGNLSVIAGDITGSPGTNRTGGTVTIRGGNTPFGPGGPVNITGGSSANGSLGPAAGAVNITGGQGASGTAAGQVVISGGPNTFGNGASAIVRGGTGGPSGNAGSAEIRGGTGTNGGGSIILSTALTTTLVERLRIRPNGAWSVGSGGTDYGSAGEALVSQGSSSPPIWSSSPTLSGTNITNIPNSALTNSSITLGSTSVSLGSTASNVTGLTLYNAPFGKTGTPAGLLTAWDATNTDIDGLISGTTYGSLIESPVIGHCTVGLRSNDLNDGFQVISKGAAVSASSDPYITLCFEVKADGSVSAAKQFLTSADDTVSAPGFSWSGDTDTGIWRPLANTLAVSTLGVERVRVDSQGRIGVGTTPTVFADFVNTSAAVLRLAGETTQAFVSDRANDAAGAGAQYQLRRSRGTLSARTIVQAGDVLGEIWGYGYDGSAIVSAARIQMLLTGTPAAGVMPGAITFSTTPAASGTVLERMRISSTGAIGLNGANFGTSGQALISQGSGSTPVWADVSSTESVITDDTTTNATMYPTWVTATSGSLPQKVSSTKLSFNPSTGQLNSVSFNATSTARVKDVIVDIGKTYLDKFMDLKPREYDRKDYPAHEFGFIAEEMIQVYPEVVSKDDAGIPSGIDYGKLSTILTAKVQEQQTIIERLQEQMNAVMELLKGTK